MEPSIFCFKTQIERVVVGGGRVRVSSELRSTQVQVAMGWTRMRARIQARPQRGGPIGHRRQEATRRLLNLAAPGRADRKRELRRDEVGASDADVAPAARQSGAEVAEEGLEALAVVADVRQHVVQLQVVMDDAKVVAETGQRVGELRKHRQTNVDEAARGVGSRFVAPSVPDGVAHRAGRALHDDAKPRRPGAAAPGQLRPAAHPNDAGAALECKLQGGGCCVMTP